MKRPFIFILLPISITIFAIVGYVAHEYYTFTEAVQAEVQDRLENTVNYYIDVPDGLDTMDFEATLTLDTNKKYHRIQFSNGGTQTTVLIYDTTFLKRFNKQEKDIQPLAEGTFGIDEKVIIDLTSFSENVHADKYYVHYLSCKMGGIFPLNVQKNKH